MARPNAENGKDEGKIVVLGQTLTYPTTIWGASCILFICVAVVWSLSIILHAPREQLETFGVVFWHLDSKNKPKEEKGVARYEFWTPSKETKNWLKEPLEGSEWMKEVDDDEKQVAQFGEQLRQQNGVKGYRRCLVWGQGRDPKRGVSPGWWWTVRVTNEFSLKDLSEFYRKFWNNPDSIYVETFNANASFQE